MLTVLHTESSFGWGGQENRTLNEMRGLKALGAHMLLACQPNAEIGHRAQAEGFTVFYTPMRRSYDLRTVLMLARLMWRQNVNIVNTHSGRDSWLAGIAGRLLRMLGGSVKIVRTRHLALPITTRISYSLLPDRVVTVSRFVKNFLVQSGVSAAKIETIPTGIRFDTFNINKTKRSLREELGLTEKSLLIGTVAILRQKKGHAVLLEAIPRILAEFPEAIFVFAGDGPQRKNLEIQISQLGLENKVHLLGLRKDIPQILASLDLFVLPTFEEALGTSFIEAMALACPVIGSDVGGVGEVIHHGENGLLVPPSHPTALAEAILILLRDARLRNEFGKMGQKIAYQEYSAEIMSQAMLAFYFKLIVK